MYLIRLLVLLSIIICTVQIKPNVLLIVVDDLRPNIGVYNYNNAFTPNLDKLAERSFVFKNAYCQQALCAPSRNSFLTSRRPDSLHLYDFYSYWRDSAGNFTTLPQHFRENGYHTHSVGKVFHPGVSSNFTDDSKYSWSDEPFHPKTEKYKDSRVCPTGNGSRARNLMCPVTIEEQPEGTLPDIETIGAALNFLKFRQSDHKPFFLAVGLHKPHIPFKYPRKYLKHHPLKNVVLPKFNWMPFGLPTVAWNPWTDLRRRDDISLLNVSFPFGHMPDDITKRIIQNYNSATSYIDDLIGQLLQKVDENTLIVFMADHGWSMGEHGEFSKFSNFDVATKVPLMIHVPKLNSKKIVVDGLVELVDIFPTMVDLTGITDSIRTCKEDKFNSKLCTEGSSLVPLMIHQMQRKEYKSKGAVFSQYPRPGTFPTLKPNSDKPRLENIKIMGYSMRTNQYRYTEWVQFDPKTFKANWSQVYDNEMYCYEIDPDENMNLASRPEFSQIVKRLRKQLILGWRFVS